MKGLGYIKGQEAPLAREDKEYPEWLWKLLGSGDKAEDADGAVGDAFGESTFFGFGAGILGGTWVRFHTTNFTLARPPTLSLWLLSPLRSSVRPLTMPQTAKSKKQRRLASKAARALKTGSNAADHKVKVPLEEQSIDLPAGIGQEEGMRAQEAREELNAAMRKARRRRIKEANFLRGMR